MFITLEGPEGSGKTSHMAPLSRWLESQGWLVLCTREPGGTSISEQIRAVIHDLRNKEMNPRTETLLYQAAHDIAVLGHRHLGDAVAGHEVDGVCQGHVGWHRDQALSRDLPGTDGVQHRLRGKRLALL